MSSEVSRTRDQYLTSRDSSTPLGMTIKTVDFMSNSSNHNCATRHTNLVGRGTVGPIRHLYVHIPFCARICPYCAFYKDLLDRSQTWGFCEAILRELKLYQGGASSSELLPSTIYFGGGTPTALTIAQLELLLRGFRERLDLSCLEEWTIEANPGSVSARKADLLKKFGVNRISLGVQAWDDHLLKLLGREHNR